MTDTIAELRALLAKATPGPWAVNPFNAHIDCAQPSDIGGLLPVCQMLWPTDERSEDETAANAKLIATMRNALPALLDRVEAGAWQPIETAPKTGETVLLFNEDEQLVDCGFFCTWVGDDRPGHWEVTGNNHWYQGDVTHWRPLPEVPQQQADTP